MNNLKNIQVWLDPGAQMMISGLVSLLPSLHSVSLCANSTLSIRCCPVGGKMAASSPYSHNTKTSRAESQLFPNRQNKSPGLTLSGPNWVGNHSNQRHVRLWLARSGSHDHPGHRKWSCYHLHQKNHWLGEGMSWGKLRCCSLKRVKRWGWVGRETE